jgi:hypothetical protein
MGIGKAHTPEAFVKACESFTYTEILNPKKTTATGKAENKGVTNFVTKKGVDFDTVENAFEMVYDDITGLALASRLSMALKKVDPTFDIRNYGYNSFRKFLEALKPKFETVVHDDRSTISIKRGE